MMMMMMMMMTMMMLLMMIVIQVTIRIRSGNETRDSTSQTELQNLLITTATTAARRQTHNTASCHALLSVTARKDKTYRASVRTMLITYVEFIALPTATKQNS